MTSSKLISKTLLNTKRRISLRGSFVQLKEKHLKQGEKISNLENASQNLIYIPLTICKRFLKRISKTFAKQKQVVQAWSKILNQKKAIHAYLVKVYIGLIPSNFCTYLIQTSSILHLYICFGLCWHQSPKRGRLKGKQAYTFS